jgi:hypothetical protein
MRFALVDHVNPFPPACSANRIRLAAALAWNGRLLSRDHLSNLLDLESLDHVGYRASAALFFVLNSSPAWKANIQARPGNAPR